MSDGIISKESRAIYKLLEENSIEIPRFQRGYSWGPQQIKALFDDTWEFFKSQYEEKQERTHEDVQRYFIGGVYTYSSEDGSYQIIDGQQRLTTWFIYALAMDDLTENNSIIKEWMDSTHNNSFYNKLRSIKKYSKEADAPEDLKKIVKALGTCKRKINSWRKSVLESGSDIDFIDDIEKFFRYCWKKVGVLDIHLSKNISAASFFKSINSKSTKLDSRDLIHTEITTLLEEKKDTNKELKDFYFDEFEKEIEQIIKEGEKKFGKHKNMDAIKSDFYRFFIAHERGKLLPLNSLKIYYEFCTWLEKDFKGDIVPVLKKIRSFFHIFKELMLGSQENFGSSYLYLRISSFNTYFPILSTIYEIINPRNSTINDEMNKDMVKCFKILAYYDISRILMGRGRAEGAKTFPMFKRHILEFAKKEGYKERPLNKLFIRFLLSNSKSPEGIPTWKIMSDVKEFEERFNNMDLYTVESAKTKALIYSIVSALQGEETDMKQNSVYTLEHIIPQNMSEYKNNMSEIQIDRIEEKIHTFGNLIIIPRAKNTKAKNKWIDDKIEILNSGNTIFYNQIVTNLIEKTREQEKDNYRSLQKIVSAISKMYLQNFKEHIVDYQEILKASH